MWTSHWCPSMEHLNFTIALSQPWVLFIQWPGLCPLRPSGLEDLEPLSEVIPYFPTVTGLWPVLGAPVLSLPYMRLLCSTDTVPQEAADPQAPPGPHFPIPSCGSSHTQGNMGHLAAYPRAAWLSYRARSQKPPWAMAYLPDADLCQLTVCSLRKQSIGKSRVHVGWPETAMQVWTSIPGFPPYKGTSSLTNTWV